MAAEKKFYITTAIDYVNDRPHIGHALEKIQADVIARYRRAKGERVWFLTGTDEHGTKIMRAAEAAGKNPQEFVNETAERFRGLKGVLNLSWDDFIRTSDRERHWPGAAMLWQKIFEAGALYKKAYRGLYCVGHEAFVTEKDLEGGFCRDHRRVPETIEEENWFFRASEFGPEILRRIRSGELEIFPAPRQNEIAALLEAGLEDVSFSRPAKNLSWGIPVPNDPDQTMYVWADALANYITAVGFGRDQAEFEGLWPADVHVIGKDILRFHAAIWPAMLLAAGLPLPRALFVHGFITVDGQKMSKTVGNVLDPIEIVREYGTDPVRYFLLREIPAGEDGDFSREKIVERYNGELANGVGNLVARVAALGEPFGTIPFAEEHLPQALGDAFRETRIQYEGAFERLQLQEALGAAMRLVGAADRFLNDTKPWAMASAEEKSKAVGAAARAVVLLGELLEPFMPETAARMREQVRTGKDGTEIKKGEGLFPRRD